MSRSTATSAYFEEVYQVLECPVCGCMVHTNAFFNIAKCSSCDWQARLDEYRDERRRRFLESIKEEANDTHEECEQVTV